MDLCRQFDRAELANILFVNLDTLNLKSNAEGVTLAGMKRKLFSLQ
jgi:hypothetical protein